MSLQIERDAKRARELLSQHEVQEAMRLRCEETEHAWENACTAFLQVYQVCKWCGERR